MREGRAVESGDWIGIGGIVVGVASAIAFSCGFAHFHDKLKTPEGRADVVADMRGRDIAKGYAHLLGSALSCLHKVAGRPFSGQSIGFCFFWQSFTPCFPLLQAGVVVVLAD